jgi:hypothetical protein
LRFEAEFGEGRVELDALEALHPGALARIIEAEIARYHVDANELDERWQEIVTDTNAELTAATEEVQAEHASEITVYRDGNALGRVVVFNVEPVLAGQFVFQIVAAKPINKGDVLQFRTATCFVVDTGQVSTMTSDGQNALLFNRFRVA